jgi:hypothetical protein
LNALRVLAQVSAAEQIVGRERNHGACHRQLVRDVVVSRRVNSNVGRIYAITQPGIMRRTTIKPVAVLLLVGATSVAQDGGSTQRVNFQNGKTSTRIRSAVDLMNPDAYVLPVRRGQRLKVHLKGKGVLVRLLTPGNRIDVDDSQAIDRNAQETGDYTIVVHCYASKSLRYRLDIHRQ